MSPCVIYVKILYLPLNTINTIGPNKFGQTLFRQRKLRTIVTVILRKAMYKNMFSDILMSLILEGTNFRGNLISRMGRHFLTIKK